MASFKYLNYNLSLILLVIILFWIKFQGIVRLSDDHSSDMIQVDFVINIKFYDEYSF